MARRKGPPKVFLSYAHEGRKHQNAVLGLATRLRRQGVDVSLDQFEESPPGGWPEWMEHRILESDFVLSVCTPVYLKRFFRQTPANDGQGVRWESRLIRQQIYNGNELQKFIPILMKGGRFKDIPAILQGSTSYHVDSPAGYTNLVLRLKGTRKIAPAPVRKRLQDFIPWHVPLPRNRWFTGRAEVLQGLRDALIAGNWIQGISGLGGMGKTQTALEYAYRFRDSYDAVFWVSAESHAHLRASFAKIARLLESGDARKDKEDPLDFVQCALDESTNWLIVFDNADTPEWLAPYLPKHANGHVLITSRAYALHHLGIAAPVELDRLPVAEALTFLFDRTGRTGGDEERAAAAKLAEELGFLPLALEQAAAYVVEKQSRFRDYLASFRKRRLSLLKRQQPVAGSYPSSVAGTWSLNFQQVKKDPAAADLLHLSAFLSPDAIPLELMVTGASGLGPNLSAALAGAAEDRLLLDEVLSSLTRYSLIRRHPDQDTFSIHRLVQEIVKDALGEQARQTWTDRAITALSQAMPAEFPEENWPRTERLMPHVFACEAAAEQGRVRIAAAGTLFHQAGWYSQQVAQYDQAERLYRRAITVWEQLGEDGESALANTLQNLGWLYSEIHRYPEIEAPLLRAQSLRERHDDPLRLAQILSILAALYVDLNRVAEAKALLERLSDVYDKLTAVKGPILSFVRVQIARLHRLLGNTAAAESLGKLVLQEDSDNWDAISLLESLYRQLGRAANAEEMYQRIVGLLAQRIANLSDRSIQVAVRRLTGPRKQQA